MIRRAPTRAELSSQLRSAENLLATTKLDLKDVCEKWAKLAAPIPMRLTCPECRHLHIDLGEFETKPHHTHACQNCGNVWRPAVVCTVGVRFLPGFKDKP